MELKTKEQLISLFEKYYNEEVVAFEQIPASGSYRQYCRLKSENRQIIGAYNHDLKENRAFIEFSKHFRKHGLPVPEVYTVSDDQTHYLIEDLGDITLFDYLVQHRQLEDFSEDIVTQYKKVLLVLPVFQINAGRDLDYSNCYPRKAFDKQSMMWDLNYFKYYFLKLARVPFDEQALEDDFQAFSDYLLSTGTSYFLYRDFQSRNIMLKDKQVYFIDYQGGRKGALQYDLASLLYDSKADIPQHIRNELLDFYLGQLEKHIPVNRDEFKAYFSGYVLIRIMQAMGAYGFRGLYEKKEHFLKSIPYALDNLRYILNNHSIGVQLPELFNVLKKVSESKMLREIVPSEGILTVRITSFSYKNGLPDDPSGNGGGFIFDCRPIHNPGRYEEYKHLSGKDKKVQEFLESNSNINKFLPPVFSLVEQSVRKYISRGYSHLSVGFGCTGGQHRSVYAADKLAEYLKNNFPVKIILQHREQENWKK